MEEQKKTQKDNTENNGIFFGQNNKNYGWSFFGTLFLLLLFNWFLFPGLGRKSIIETDYGTFLNMVDEGLVKEVSINKGYVYFSSETETVNNPYLGSDTSLACSAETAAKIDEEVRQIIATQHDKARNIIRENEPAMHRLTEFLLTKETITGEEFMRILQQPTEKLRK